MAIGELRELPVGQRDHLDGMLANARAAGRIRGDEYDFRVGQDLGLVDWLRGGVKCGIDDRRGGFTTWTVPGPDEDTHSFLAMWGDNGALVTAPDPSSRGLLGNVKGVAQTFLWNLVRPTDCKFFIDHRPGLTPTQHVEIREAQDGRLRQFLHNPWVVGIGVTIIGGLFLWAILGG